MLIGSTLDGAYTFFRVSPDPQKLAPMFTIGGEPTPWTFQGETVWDAAREINRSRDTHWSRRVNTVTIRRERGRHGKHRLHR